MTDDRQPRPALLFSLVVLMLFIWTINFIIGKIALRHFPALTLVAFRLVLASMVMSLIYLFTPRHTRLDRGDGHLFIILGVLGVVMNQGGFTYGLNFTTAGHSSIIIAIAPVIVLILARIVGLESISRRKAIGISLCFIGAIVLAAENGLAAIGSLTLKGDLITLQSVFAYSISVILAKKVIQKYDTFTMNFFNFLVAGICLLPLAIREGLRLDWHSVGWAGWLGLAFMSICSSVISYLIYYWALRHMEASRLAATTYVEPVFVPILGLVLLGEHLTLNLLIGGGLVLVGVYITERALGARAIPPEPI
ncbi:MAG: DMT family transporter [Candidatus Acidiferrales bacterium]